MAVSLTHYLACMKRWQKEGMRPGDGKAKDLLGIDSPSHRDLAHAMADLEGSIAQLRNNNQFRQVEQGNQVDGFVIPRNRHHWERTRDVIEVQTKELQQTRNFFQTGGLHLGTVLACSGFREKVALSGFQNKDKCLSVMDWALVKPRNGRLLGTNTVRHILPDIQYLRFG